MATEKAVFGMGCFWSPEAFFGGLKEVKSTETGYAGGSKENPSYRSLGDHTEVVKIVFDPEKISYNELIRLFFSQHDVRTSVKKQYQSLIVPQSSEQKTVAEKIASEKLDEENDLRIEDSTFWPAEDYHQKYHLQNSEIFKFFEEMSDEEFRKSTLASRANAYVTENCGKKQVLSHVEELSPDPEQKFREILERK